LELATICAICGTLENTQSIYPSTLDQNSFTAKVFSARRLPDRKHYQWVKCRSCSLYRSDPVQDIDLAKLYRDSTFDYSREIHGLKNSYRNLVLKACPNPIGKTILEIGGGNGFFLEEALEMGFSNLIEIEPSTESFNLAREELKKYFIVDTLKSGLVPDNSVDCAVSFHVLDHLPDPKSSLVIIHQTLRARGVVCIAVHNVNSISSRLLKDKSPIFDVEHTYLYSKKTIKSLLESAGFGKIKVSHYRNTYSLEYLIHLIPIPRNLKIKLLGSRTMKSLGKIRVTLPLGNIYAIGEKI
jgi:SAM-dependent methyltransferase